MTQTPQYPPPYATPPTPKRKSAFRRAFFATFGVIAALAVIGVLAGLLAAGGSNGRHPRHVAASSCPAGWSHVGSDGACAPDATPAGPALNGTQQQLVNDIRDKYNFNAGVADSDIVAYGQSVCSGRAAGGSQSDAEQVSKTAWTHMSASDAYKMTRLAESDMCPAWLPVMRWHVLGSYTITGMGSSPEFTIRPGNTALRVTYRYSGNSTGFGGDNYAVDLVSGTDDISLANDIAVSGGHSTRVYPDLSFGGSRHYHAEVQMADSGAVTTITIEQRY
jgi:hypothetical protein